MSGETFEILLRPNLQSVRRLVHSRLKGTDHADDIVQNALLRAFSHRDQLRNESQFKSWLLSIAFNEVRMFFRKSRPCISLEDFPHREFVDRAPSPLAQCERQQQQQRLRAGLARLTKRDRTAIQLVDLSGMKAEDAARRLAVSKAAFKSAHFRARQRLGQALRKAA